jgi:NAD(P)-dependent dehydrogenase (short-subunit alcohol dehydrogenase family)
MDIRLDGRVALVTGGSRGIGRGIAAAFADAGASVMLVGRREESLRVAAAGMTGEVDIHPADVADPDAASLAVRATLERFGRLDVLVNNAGTNPHFGAVLEIEPAAYDKLLAVNLRAPLLWAAAAWREALRERPGVILNVSSTASLRVGAGTGMYGVTKAALDRLTRQLANEIAPTRVLSIVPGLIATDFSRVLVERVGEARARALPMGRLGTVEDVAALALFLASDHASWITAETYVIDGGGGAVPTDARQ